MGVRKKEVKPLVSVKTDFTNALQNVVDTGNLLITVLETALQHNAVDGKVADMVRERVTAFREAMYGTEWTAMAAPNDPRVIAKLLRAMAQGTEHKASDAVVIFTAAADLLDPLAESRKPLFYVKGNAVFQRPVRTNTGTRMGFCVCTVTDGIDPLEVCAILNKGEPATE